MQKFVSQIVPGDKIEAPGGIFTVTATANGFDNAVCLRGTVDGVLSDWRAYDVGAVFTVVTVH